jgi:hypothetical protein
VLKQYFSARWTGTFHFASGRYTLNTFSDDGVRVYVDGRRVINSWQPMRGYRSATLNLSEGTHTVRVEYFERTGRAGIRFWWTTDATVVAAPSMVPVTSVLPSKAGGPFRLDAWPVGSYCTAGGWVAKIFVEGHGGDGLYTYAWDGKKMGGPTSRSLVFEVESAGWSTAIVGGATATSGGKTVEVELFVPHPKCP